MLVPNQIIPRLQAKVSALIRANLRGHEKGILIPSVLFLIVFLSSLLVSIWHPGWQSTCGIIVGLAGIIGTAIRSVSVATRFRELDTLPTKIDVAQDELRVETPLGDESHMIRLVSFIRQVVQNRQPPPLPQGEVDTRNITDKNAVTAYSEQQAKEIQEELVANVKEHDKRILEYLKEAERKIILLTEPKDGPVEQDRKPTKDTTPET